MGEENRFTSELEDLKALEAMHRYYRWKADLVRPHVGTCAIEVGCGTGSLFACLPGTAQLVGIDRDPDCVAAAERRLSGSGRATFRVMDVTSPDFLSLASLHPTSVHFVSSLEEIREDALAVRQAAAVLSPGGRVVVFVSALPGIAGTLDRVYDQHRYRRAEVRDLMLAAGLRVVESRYVNLLGALAWIWDSRILRRQATPSGDYGRRDLAIPFARVLDRLTGPPVGRSLFVVAEKPAA